MKFHSNLLWVNKPKRELTDKSSDSESESEEEPQEQEQEHFLKPNGSTTNKRKLVRAFTLHLENVNLRKGEKANQRMLLKKKTK